MAERRLPTQVLLDRALRAISAAGSQVESVITDERGAIVIQIKPPPRHGPCIYVVGISENSPVKIGFTKGPISARIKSLQTGSPKELRLIFSAIATQQDEFAIHRAFAADRISGEWFKRSRRLSRFLDAVGRGDVIAEALARV